MYEELIKRLREYATEDQWVQTRIGDTFVEAADAIEVLSKMEKTKQLIPVTELLPDWMPLPEPPKEV